MIFNVINILIGTFAFAIYVIKFTHFFQLNSYRAVLQLKWMKNNFNKLLPNLVFGLAALAGSFIAAPWCFVTAIAAFLLGGALSKPRQAKKPLVYTMRVKRLLVTVWILYGLFITVGIKLDKSAMFQAIAFLAAPLWIIVSNIVNKPIEKAIMQYYINDAKKMLSSSNAKVIGKTSVKYYLATLLKAKYNVLMTPESYNTPMGVVITIRKSLNALHDIFICEMGAKRVGEIKEICDIVHPDAGVITAIGPQHLETFKTLDNIKKTKFELADSLPEGGMLFLNGSDKNIEEHKGPRNHISYSLNGSGNYNAKILSLSEKGTHFAVTAPNGEECEFTTKLIGSHNVLNITGAIAVSHSMGIELSILKAQVAKLEPVPHRLELIKRGNDIIIDDAYNSNPSGTKAALETLSCFKGMKILVTPGMVELGSRQNELNRKFGEAAAGICDYVILVGKQQTESIHEGLVRCSYPHQRTYIASDFNDAISYAYSINSKGEKKIILLENDLPDNY